MKPVLTLIVFLAIQFVTHAQSSLIGTWRPIKITESNNNQIIAHIDDVEKKEVSKNSPYGDITFYKDFSYKIEVDSSREISNSQNWFGGIQLKGNWKNNQCSILQIQYSKNNSEDYILLYKIKKLTTSDLEIIYQVQDKKAKTIIQFKRIR